MENTRRTEPAVPVYILSGFLGSGKTTFLTQVIDYFTALGRKPAVIMNEIGEVNLDGLLIDRTVPMAELLSGCICCTIRDDLGITLSELLAAHQPDLIFIESTGVAHPLEIVDEVTDASFTLPVELKSVISIVDAPQLLQLSRTSAGKTFLLMQEQIRCASVLVLNKTDLVVPSDLPEVEQLLRDWNPKAYLEQSVHAQITHELMEVLEQKHDQEYENGQQQRGQREEKQHEHNPCKAHSSHEHVIAYTHYFDKSMDSHEFELFISRLPDDIYRAKGIVTFRDTQSRFMFQYAYGEVDFVKITPPDGVRDVGVFIGENFSKEIIRSSISLL
ncbi:CobW family GTP-binding protein [Paenibacillus eucommiae]|uniref:G3E family GTPase n=1 Tax=Paenibacillus eucommiae TaxID=1355755 RepID=A0ABS4IWG1_9BACL|nr:GTP-binding protein [Paenibacillus eucommiae]MBP1991420.1 G3E family GTPase [Paenibacillus eucommiae]